MAVTPGRLGRRYLPFVAVAAVQVLLVAVAPSRGPQAASDQQVASGVGQTANNGAGSQSTSGGGSGDLGSNVSTPGGGGGTGGTGGTGGVGGTGGTGGTGGGAPDLSKCDPKTGKEIGPLTGNPGTNFVMPHCLPVFHGTNGGATMTGVSATTINYVSFQIHGDPTFNAATGAAGLASNAQQWCEAQSAFRDEIQKRWELFGRKLNSLDGPGGNSGKAQPNQGGCQYPFFQSQCNPAPADEPCYRAEAKVIASMKPAIVLSETLDPALFDELARQHIIVITTATTPFSSATYQQYAPYFYGVFMDGNRLANFDAEYWCKKLNNKPVAHAGADVMTTRNWGPTPGTPPTRKVGVLFPETAGDTSTKVNIDLFTKLVSGGPGSMCKTPGGVFAFGYSQDASQAVTQSNTAVNALIQNHITTVMCWCDLLSPVFLTRAADGNNYYPEHFIVGEGLIDASAVGRLYQPTQWAHAFGITSLPQMKPWAQSDAVRAWNDVRTSGQPFTDEGLYLLPFLFMGNALMEAGPSPTPQGIHQGLLNMGSNGGWAKLHDPHIAQWGLDQVSPWTFAQDMGEIYWSQNRTAEEDGKPGSYCPVAGGRRYAPGQFSAGDPDVFDPATNGC